MPQSAYREGQTATNPKTGQTIVYRNGQWVSAPSAPGAPVQRKLSPQEQKVLNEANAAAQEGQSIQRDYNELDSARKRLGTGPWRGSFLDAAIPTEDGGIMDTLGGWLIGGPARLVGAIDQGDVDAYNTFRRVQSRRVLAEQKQQRGVQTEGDAARIKAGDVGVRASSSANAGAVQRGRQESQLLIDRASALTQWANRYGVNGLNERGQTFQQVFDASRPKPAAPKAGTPTIRRVK